MRRTTTGCSGWRREGSPSPPCFYGFSEVPWSQLGVILWGMGVVLVLIHSLLDYPTREPVIGVILFSLLGAMASVDEMLAKVVSLQ